jgi:nucleotide-binding universal stress UspA family protein
MTYKHILAPTDLSDASNHALRHAFAEADIHHARLTLLHVLPSGATTDVYYVKGAPDLRSGLRSSMIGAPIGFDPATGGTLPVPSASSPEIVRFDHNEEVLDQLRDLVPDNFKGAWDVEVSTGKTADAILRTAHDQDVDLIVMGTHGRTGLSHTFLGSVAEAVMHHASCPVLMVRFGT